uniref:Uncharacterized protein n=1 Tax=Denticeps clupeoides TaxID=299321 RepID=A0AAY4E109_9TELE
RRETILFIECHPHPQLCLSDNNSNLPSSLGNHTATPTASADVPPPRQQSSPHLPVLRHLTPLLTPPESILILIIIQFSLFKLLLHLYEGGSVQTNSLIPLYFLMSNV